MSKIRRYLDKIDITYRIVLFFLFGVAVISALAYTIFKPSSYSLLIKDAWCVDRIYYKRQLIGPKTLIAFHVVYSNGLTPCYENAEFRENGILNLPGVNTSMISGTWKLENNNRIQINSDTLKNIFQGIYNFDVSLNNLVLQSNTTTLYCHKDKTAFPKLF